MNYMQGHKLPNVKKSVCVKEQVIAYNLANQIYASIVYPTFNMNYPFVNGIIKADFESWLRVKVFEWYDNLFKNSKTVQKLNMDLIIHCCINGILNQVYSNKKYVVNCIDYIEVGKIYNTLYEQID